MYNDQIEGFSGRRTLCFNGMWYLSRFRHKAGLLRTFLSSAFFSRILALSCYCRELCVGSHNARQQYATCTSPIMHLICPPPPPRFCKTFVFHFSWVLQLFQEKLKTILTYAKFWEDKYGALWEMCKWRISKRHISFGAEHTIKTQYSVHTQYRRTPLGCMPTYVGPMHYLWGP